MTSRNRAATDTPTSGAARQVVDALVAAGVDHAFTVPGESFLPILDALHDEPRIRTVTTRHEGGAAFMAEAYAKLTRKPTVCMATRAVGAANLAIGLHTARQDDSPVIALLGQVSSRHRHRESFQEADLCQLLGTLTKWSLEPAAVETLGPLTYQAARVSMEGRPGPVAIAYREDLLYGESATPACFPPLRLGDPVPDPDLLARGMQILRGALHPCLLLGADVLASGSTDPWVRFAQAEQIPVVTAWRRPDVFPNDHQLYVGQAGLGAVPCVKDMLVNADVILAAGCRLDENTTFGYTVPGPDTSLIHVYSDAGWLVPSNGAPGIVAGARATAEALLQLAARDPLPNPQHQLRRDRADRLHVRWLEQTECFPGRVREGFADQFSVTRQLRSLITADSVVVTDAGNFSSWIARYGRWNRPGTFLGPISGAMGYAVPAAVGAALGRPDRPVVALAGDGGFMMTAVELQTAVRLGVRFTVIVFDNCHYGTIRMHQQRNFPGRPIATSLGSVDFAGLARSLGAHAAEVTSAPDFTSAFNDAQRQDGPSVIVVRTDPHQLSVDDWVRP